MTKKDISAAGTAITAAAPGMVAAVGSATAATTAYAAGKLLKPFHSSSCESVEKPEPNPCAL